jgi:hypothetical protein
VEQEASWCPCCRDFVASEKISPIKELERSMLDLKMQRGIRYRDLSRFRSHLLEEKGEVVDLVGRAISELQKRILWRRGRHSPPRCLECGSAELAPLPGPNEGAITLPEIGERIEFASISGMSVEGDPEFVEYSPEGERFA